MTGASGFIGGEIATELQRAGYKVTAVVRPGSDSSYLLEQGIAVVEGDVTNPTDMARSMEGQTFVCHAAALVPGSGADATEFERVNVGGTHTVCEAAVQAGVTRLLHVSTAHVFGIQPGATIDEKVALTLRPHEGYDASKVAAEAVVREHSTGELDSIVINPTIVFGPRSRHSGRLINLFLNGRLPVIPLPDRTLSLVYSGDVGRGARLALELGEPGEHYILAGPTVTVREFIGALATVSGRRAPRLSLPSWAVTIGVAAAQAASPITRWRLPVTLAGIRHGGTVYDGRRAERELGVEYTPLEDALATTVEWLQTRR